MLTLLIIFISICLAGAAFWFFNKRQINSLVENIDDKQAIINALQSHVESVQTPVVEKKTKRNDGQPNKNKRPYNKGNKTNGTEKNNRPKQRKPTK
jgi:hypothetical protein